MADMLSLGEYMARFPNPQKGPCLGCGAENYGLSMGGPAICPACDCTPTQERVRHLAEENRLLRQRIADLEAELERRPPC